MTIPLATRLANFDEMSDENRRAFISRLRVKEARIESELVTMRLILKRYDQLKAVRLTKRKEDIHKAWLGDVI